MQFSCEKWSQKVSEGSLCSRTSSRSPDFLSSSQLSCPSRVLSLSSRQRRLTSAMFLLQPAGLRGQQLPFRDTVWEASFITCIRIPLARSAMWLLVASKEHQEMQSQRMKGTLHIGGQSADFTNTDLFCLRTRTLVFDS